MVRGAQGIMNSGPQRVPKDLTVIIMLAVKAPTSCFVFLIAKS